MTPTNNVREGLSEAQASLEVDAATAASPAAGHENHETIAKFRRLLNPIWMHLVYNAMGGEPAPDDGTYIFTFMGGGGSDMTTFGEFRELMGDERRAVADMDAAESISKATGAE